MSKMMCIPCSVEFATDAIYMAHKRGGHKDLSQATPLDTLPVPTPPPGVPQNAMPSKEFMETVARIESQKDQPPATEPSTPSQHPSELPKAIPLILEYIWRGEHEKCRRQPSTLKLEVGGKFFTVAYCEGCKEQLESKEVAKLGS